MEHKILGFKFNLTDLSDAGTFSGYASTFGNEDLGGDIVKRGAFGKTIVENPDVPILWTHRDVIGKNLTWKEDRHGLWVKGELNLALEKARDAHALVKQGAVKGLSIGYDAVRVDYSRQKEGIRVLEEVKVFEYSLTPFPMNQEARIQNVKTLEDMQVELVRIKQFIEKTPVSLQLRNALQQEMAAILALLATSPGKATGDAGEAAASQQNVAPEDLHPTFQPVRETFRDDLKKFSLTD